jgi:hypothetical protein
MIDQSENSWQYTSAAEVYSHELHTYPLQSQRIPHICQCYCTRQISYASNRSQLFHASTCVPNSLSYIYSPRMTDYTKILRNTRGVKSYPKTQNILTLKLAFLLTSESWYKHWHFFLIVFVFIPKFSSQLFLFFS